jgi:uncharacterized protein YutE (UPF0331/DUF86 family)
VVDRDKVLRKLKKLEECLQKLKTVAQISKEEYLASDILQDSTERNFQLAAQACIDIAHHVIADSGWEVPKTYGQAFDILSKHGELPPDLAQTMISIAGFRNILVHDYTEVDPDQVYQYLSRLDDFASFARHAITWLDKGKGKGLN